MGQSNSRLNRTFIIVGLVVFSAVALVSTFYGVEYFIPSAVSQVDAGTGGPAYVSLLKQGTGRFQSEEEFAATAREVMDQMRYRHYRELQLSEDNASDFINHMLDLLDPTRAILLADDVAEIRSRARQAIRPMLVGQLDPLFDIYNRYQQRMDERYAFLMQFMNNEHDKQDFTIEEMVELDREGGDWPTTTEQLDELWRRQHKSATLNLLLTDKEAVEVRKILQERYERQISQLEKTRNEDVFVILMNVITTFYDPHSQYFSPRQYETFAIRMNLSVQGIGAVLKAEGEYVTVQRLIPGGPADLSRQIRIGDRFIAIGEGQKGELVNVVGWRLDDVVALIRGEIGTSVRLQIQPFDSVNQRQNRVITLERNEVRLEEQAAQKKLLTMEVAGKEFQLGVVKVPTFYVNFDDQRAGKKDYRSSTRDVLRLLRELDADGAQGLVVDLRDNGGGSLDEAISLSGLFVPNGGPVLQVREEGGRVGTMTARQESYQYRKPVVVIVNRLSASASEIFAAALQDYHRAIILGERTYGKGSVQRIIMLANGQLKYTSALFYRINGDTTQHQGVMPDIVFPSYFDHATIGESALDNALPADRIRSLRYPEAPINLPPVPWLIEKHLENNLLDPDYMQYYKLANRLTVQRKKKELSLVLAERKEESERELALQLQYENDRRSRKKLPLLESSEELESEEEIKEQILEKEFNRGIEDTEDKPDVLLRASARILAEMIRYEYDKSSTNIVRQ